MMEKLPTVSCLSVPYVLPVGVICMHFSPKESDCEIHYELIKSEQRPYTRIADNKL